MNPFLLNALAQGMNQGVSTYYDTRRLIEDRQRQAEQQRLSAELARQKMAMDAAQAQELADIRRQGMLDAQDKPYLDTWEKTTQKWDPASVAQVLAGMGDTQFSGRGALQTFQKMSAPVKTTANVPVIGPRGLLPVMANIPTTKPGFTAKLATDPAKESAKKQLTSMMSFLESRDFQDSLATNPSVGELYFSRINELRAGAGEEPLSYGEFKFKISPRTQIEGDYRKKQGEGIDADIRLDDARVKKLNADIQKDLAHMKYRWANLDETKRHNYITEAQGNERLAISRVNANVGKSVAEARIQQIKQSVGGLTPTGYVAFRGRVLSLMKAEQDKLLAAKLPNDDGTVKSEEEVEALTASANAQLDRYNLELKRAEKLFGTASQGGASAGTPTTGKPKTPLADAMRTMFTKAQRPPTRAEAIRAMKIAFPGETHNYGAIYDNVKRSLNGR